jgi:arylsulfatase A-like enzyme
MLWGLAVGCATGCAAPEWTARNVVLITVDTLRADHLGCYGYPRPISPFIDWMASEGVVFERSFTASSTTAPAHATLLTGLYPSQHRLRRNGQQLPADAVLLPELLAERGFDTAGFVSTNGHFVASGLNRGFDHMDEPGRGLIPDKVSRPAKLTVALAARWLRSRISTAPLFLWVHVFDPHTPYQPEEPLRLRSAERHALGTFLLGEHGLDTRFFGGSEQLMVDLINAYDGEIAAVDRAIRDLYKEVGETVGTDDTLWVLTSDHGEGLGNHEWLLHGKKIYNEQLRVPLIFHAPGGLAPARIESITEHVDLLPTLLDLVGADPPTDGMRRGRSLRPALLESTGSGEAFAFSERRSFAESAAQTRDPIEPGASASGDVSIESLLRDALHDNYEPGERYSIQNERFKLIWNSELGSELYDLESDPYEQLDLAGSRPELESELVSRLTARLEQLRASALRGEAIPVDPKARRALEALGYIDPP